MYIPAQRYLRENKDPLSSSLTDLLDYQLEPELYYLGARSTVDPTQEQTSYHVPSEFVGVSVAALVFVLLVIAFAVYKRCNGGSDSDSDTVSSISESAWRVEDPESESDATEAKHRKRLRKLDQVAPVQSLHDWRAEKLLTNVETFATVSTKLICAICLDLINEDEQIRELPCGHVYHSACLNLWVERGHHDCPLCKYDILGLRAPPPSPREVETTNDDNATRSPSPPRRQHQHHHRGPQIVVISNAQPQPGATNVHGALSPLDSARG